LISVNANHRTKHSISTILKIPPLSKRQKQNKGKEATMVTVASIRNSKNETTCTKCGEALIAPEWSEYFSEEQCVLNLWTCPNCGNRFETEACMLADAEAMSDDAAIKAFFPSLLVA
jgi:RNase P subunit RPR2